MAEARDDFSRPRLKRSNRAEYCIVRARMRLCMCACERVRVLRVNVNVELEIIRAFSAVKNKEKNNLSSDRAQKVLT